MKERKKKMWVIIGMVLLIISVIIIFFNIPYSKTKKEFYSLANNYIEKSNDINEIFTEKDIEDLPIPIQKYFRNCGYIGKPKMSYMSIIFHDVNFSMGKDKPMLKIEYTQYNFVDEISRVAYIGSGKFGIPFEGLDTYVNGNGSMKGVIAKLFTLFNVKGEAMNRSALVTYLAEVLLIPNVALQDFITWEAINDTSVKATISNYGISVSGIFTFDNNGLLLNFTSNDREITEPDGTSKKVRWSAIFGNYQETDGIKKPTSLKAIWHYDDGDQTYFDGNNIDIQFNNK